MIPTGQHVLAILLMVAIVAAAATTIAWLMLHPLGAGLRPYRARLLSWMDWETAGAIAGIIAFLWLCTSGLTIAFPDGFAARASAQIGLVHPTTIDHR